MPRMGQSMEEGSVVKWLVDEGDAIKKGDPVAEIETDKSVITLESTTEGTMEQIIASVGEVIPVGQPIAYLEDGKKGGKPAAFVSSDVPEEQSSKRLKASPAARKYAEEEKVDLKEVVAVTQGDFITKSDVDEFIRRSKRIAATQSETQRVNASPLAKRLAAELGVDLKEINGTGAGGMISKEDVTRYAAQPKQKQVPQGSSHNQPSISPLSKVRKKTAEIMAQSKQRIPHFYVSMDVNMGPALGLRQSLINRGEDISINDLIVRGTTIALEKYPNLNAIFSENEVRQFPHIDMAVAISNGDALITPVIKNCERLSLVELSKATKALIARTRSGSLTAEDLATGTFTVSNLGMYGIKEFSAIINPPQVAILAVGSVQKVPVFDNENRIVAAQVVRVSLSADHRVTDGAEVAGFLRDLKLILEDGFQLI